MAGSHVLLTRGWKKDSKWVLFPLFILFFLPLGSIFRSLIGEEGLQQGLEQLKELLASRVFQRSLSFSILQALISAAISIIIALPGAYLFSHYRFKFKRLILSISSISFILPPILVVLAFVIFWGQRGWVNQLWLELFPSKDPIRILYSPKAIILAHVFYNIPLALRFIYDGWTAIPRQQDQAARSLGASKLQSFRQVILPQLLPSILSSFMIIFLYCFLSFSIVLVLGGGPVNSTLEVEIYQSIKFTQDYFNGAWMALIEMLISLIFMLIYLYYQKRQERIQHRSLRYQDMIPLKKKGVLILSGYSTLYLLFLGAPLIALITQSFLYQPSRTGDYQWSFHWFQSLFQSRAGNWVSIKAISFSLLYALLSSLTVTVLCALLGHLLLRKKLSNPRLTEVLILLPMGISSVILALSYLKIRLALPSNAAIKTILIVSIHSMIGLPFAYRSLKNRILRIPQSLLEAGANLGATPRQSLYLLEWPLLKQSLLSGMLFSFALSMGEVNAVLVLSQGRDITIPLAIYRLIGNYNFNGAAAMGTLLLIITLASFLLMERINGSNKI